MHINLNASGIPTTFFHSAQKFSYKAEFDNGTATPTEARSHFLAAVGADRTAAAARRADAAADEAAGIMPF